MRRAKKAVVEKKSELNNENFIFWARCRCFCYYCSFGIFYCCLCCCCYYFFFIIAPIARLFHAIPIWSGFHLVRSNADRLTCSRVQHFNSCFVFFGCLFSLSVHTKHYKPAAANERTVENEATTKKATTTTTQYKECALSANCCSIRVYIIPFVVVLFFLSSNDVYNVLGSRSKFSSHESMTIFNARLDWVLFAFGRVIVCVSYIIIHALLGCVCVVFCCCLCFLLLRRRRVFFLSSVVHLKYYSFFACHRTTMMCTTSRKIIIKTTKLYIYIYKT